MWHGGLHMHALLRWLTWQHDGLKVTTIYRSHVSLQQRWQQQAQK